MMSNRSDHTRISKKSGRCTISALPPEILSHIFKYLSTNERKSVKRVCRLWFEACNIPSLLDGEVLICLGIYRLSDTCRLLNRSKRRFMSLQFELVNFHYKSLFWEKNGHKIRSINFVNCTFSRGTLENIIVYCVNLINLSLMYRGQFAYELKFSESPINQGDLEILINSGIVRENLKSLKITVGHPHRIQLSDYVLHQLLTIFPKVTMVDIRRDKHYEGEGTIGIAEYSNSDLSKFSNKDRLTLAPVLNHLASATDRIEKLIIHFPSQKYTVNILQPPFSAMKKLTYLSTDMDISPLLIDEKALLIYSKLLESLEFNLGFKEDIYLEEEHSNYSISASVSLKIIFSRSRFKHLKIRYDESFIVSKADFEKLISFCSKHFNLSIRSIRAEHPNLYIPYILAQNKFTAPSDLLLGLYSPEEDIVSAFMQTFQNLSFLHLTGTCDHDIESLLQFKMKLKALIIDDHKENIGSFDQYRCDLFKNAFNELTDIQYLNLSMPYADIFVRCLSPENILTNLKYLSLEFKHSDENQLAFTYTYDFLEAAYALPFLEGLRIINRAQDVAIDFFVELSRKLKRLRFFSYEGALRSDHPDEDPILMYEDFKEVFKVCPSLRALVLKQNTTHQTYFFDTINEEVDMIHEAVPNIPLVFSRPRIENITLAWLKLL